MAASKPTPPPEKTQEQIEYERKYGRPTSPPPPPKKYAYVGNTGELPALIARTERMGECLDRMIAKMNEFGETLSELERRLDDR